MLSSTVSHHGLKAASACNSKKVISCHIGGLAQGSWDSWNPEERKGLMIAADMLSLLSRLMFCFMFYVVQIMEITRTQLRPDSPHLSAIIDSHFSSLMPLHASRMEGLKKEIV